ncbi:alpha-(1,3)-fucosyltransferase C-like [Portunus trituberculatus]|uniref:alpha-(1,3)-fucosyltransferase C-like n=1 Tax=Portunus trituberculatus TaxID=210409 RepID=UPI001E1CC68F|nr:alpha-(1,3)-fucosyltransferase C-like [Portunus trituberculatus]
MWSPVSNKNVVSSFSRVMRCGRLLAVSLGLLLLLFYRDATCEAQKEQRHSGHGDTLGQEDTREVSDGASLSAGSQDIDGRGDSASPEEKFKGNVTKRNGALENYSRNIFAMKNEVDEEKTVEEKKKTNINSLINQTARLTTITTATNTSTTSKHSLATTTTTTITEYPADHPAHNSFVNHKKVLFYTPFFSGTWEDELKVRTSLMHKCPVTSCLFLEGSSHPEDADAVVFHSFDFDPEHVPAVRRPEQVYVWLSMESPRWDGFGYGKVLQFGRPRFFNWTSTYHRESDVMQPYGGLLPLHGEADYVRPGLLDKSGVAYGKYLAALAGGYPQQEIKGKDWAAFLERPKLLAWMVSHCSTSSGREVYVLELQKHIEVDVYGSCGELKCSIENIEVCYTKILRPTYKFYLAFENNLCEDYITEKTWLPLHYGLVPVVFGGARYSDILPPFSYVDATHRTPLQLANHLSSIARSPELYGRYHLWRKYWEVLPWPPLCEICLKLHSLASELHRSGEDVAQRQNYPDLRGWWWGANNCTSLYPRHQYEELVSIGL